MARMLPLLAASCCSVGATELQPGLTHLWTTPILRQQLVAVENSDLLSTLQELVLREFRAFKDTCDPLEAEVTGEFMPWLMDQMSEKLDSWNVAAAIADELLSAAGGRFAQMAEEMAKLEAQRVANEEAEKAAAAAKAAEEEEYQAKLAAEKAAAAEADPDADPDAPTDAS